MIDRINKMASQTTSLRGRCLEEFEQTGHQQITSSSSPHRFHHNNLTHIMHTSRSASRK